MDSNSIESASWQKQMLFRRQFFLGPRPFETEVSWRHEPCGDGLTLSVHPDLEYTQFETAGVTLHLLGFIFDPDEPSHSNLDVLKSIDLGDVAENRFGSLLRETSRFSGRFVVIADGPSELKIFHDALGSRSVFYSFEGERLFCASQPHTIAQQTGLGKVNDPLVLEYIDSPDYAKAEHVWAGDTTLFEGVFRLMPNHYLDAGSKSAIRFWPNEAIDPVTIEEAIEESTRLLLGCLTAANNRFELVQALTAGWDTRLLLALSRGVQRDIRYYVQSFGDIDSKHVDIVIPERLARKYKLPFKVVDASKVPPLNFTRMVKKNVSQVQSDAKVALYYSFNEEFLGKLNISTMGSEIGRCALIPINGVESTAEKLAEDLGRRDSAFAVREAGRWISETGRIAEQYGVPWIELFYWEQRLGNWGASFVSDADIAIEEYYPFNCRRLFTLWMGLEPSQRRWMSPDIHRGIIDRLWPEIMSEPINKLPVSAIGSAKSFGKRIFRKIGRTLSWKTAMLCLSDVAANVPG